MRRDIKYNQVFHTGGHTYLTCQLYYQRIVSKYKCLSSSFFKLREREYVIAVLRKCVGRNSLKVYLAFDGFLLRVFSLLRASGMFWSSACGVCYFLSRALFCFFTRSLGQIPRPLMATSVLKTDFLISISADKKGCYFRFQILANHLASFFCQAIRSDYYLFHPVTECKHLLALILTWICYFGCKELTYIPIPLFNGQSLAVC